MAAEHANMWQDVLPAVYELILSNTDKIVDDTSLEKLLGLLQHMSKDSEQRPFLTNRATLKFLTDIQQSRNGAAVGFGLRLAGVVGSFAEGFSLLANPESSCSFLSSDNLFCKVLKEGELWFDPVVRDGYFKGAMEILNVNEGILWIQNSGCLQQAINCLVDSSIFVAAEARKFISKYLVTLFISNQDKTTDCNKGLNGQHSENIKSYYCHKTWDTAGSLNKEDLGCVKCIICHLQYLIQLPPSGLEMSMPYQVSIAQLVLSLMEYNPAIAQDILHQCDIVHSALELLSCTQKNECGKVVDVMTTMMNKTRKWNINWELLLNAYGQNVLLFLLEFPFVLYKRSFEFLAFQFIQGLFASPCNCELQNPWLCSLFALITFPVHATLGELMTNGNKTNDFCPKEAAKNLLLFANSRNDAYQMLDSVLTMSSKEYLSSATVSQSLLMTVDIIKDLRKAPSSPQLKHLIRCWTTDVLRLLSRQSENHQSGNHVLRHCIKVLTECVRHGFLRNEDRSDFQKEDETYRLLLKLTVERSDSQTLSACLEGMRTLLLSANQSSLTRYIQEDFDNVTLGGVLRRHCSHPCWDVKDSVLGFVKHLLVTFTGEKLKLFQNFILEHRLLNLVWSLTGDIESYVRASAIQLVGVISNQDIPWKSFCDEILLSPEDVLRRILDSFLDDEAAFPRRAMIDLLTLWIDSNHELASSILRQEPNLKPHVSLQGAKLDARASDVMGKACQDFDWEVKICALSFWESVLKWYIEKASDQNETGGEGYETQETLLHGNVTSFPRARIDTLSSIGLDKVVVGALIDCDKPVRRKGLEMLQLLRRTVFDTDVPEIREQKGGVNCIGSVDELENHLSKMDRETSCFLGEILAAVDISELAKDFENGDLFSDPLPFLKDILLAAKESDDNLLDCY